MNTQIGATTLAASARAAASHRRGRRAQLADPAHRGDGQRRRQPRGAAAAVPDCSSCFRCSPSSSPRGSSCGVLMQPGNNIGYFGPYEHRWRATDARVRTLLGRAPPATPARHRGGRHDQGLPVACHLRLHAAATCATLAIEDIWDHSGQLRFTRDRTVEDLWGFCRLVLLRRRVPRRVHVDESHAARQARATIRTATTAR